MGSAARVGDSSWSYLEGDGDFRSAEVTALRDEADMVITNPPFSLFREFMDWLMAGGVKFSVIGTTNMTSYQEVFPLFQQNKLWKGATANTTDMVFGVPKGAPVKPSDRDKAAKLGYPSDDKYDHTRMGNACWYTTSTTADDTRRCSQGQQLTPGSPPRAPAPVFAVGADLDSNPCVGGKPALPIEHLGAAFGAHRGARRFDALAPCDRGGQIGCW